MKNTRTQLKAVSGLLISNKKRRHDPIAEREKPKKSRLSRTSLDNHEDVPVDPLLQDVEISQSTQDDLNEIELAAATIINANSSVPRRTRIAGGISSIPDNANVTDALMGMPPVQDEDTFPSPLPPNLTAPMSLETPTPHVVITPQPSGGIIPPDILGGGAGCIEMYLKLLVRQSEERTAAINKSAPPILGTIGSAVTSRNTSLDDTNVWFTSRAAEVNPHKQELRYVCLANAASPQKTLQGVAQAWSRCNAGNELNSWNEASMYAIVRASLEEEAQKIDPQFEDFNIWWSYKTVGARSKKEMKGGRERLKNKYNAQCSSNEAVRFVIKAASISSNAQCSRFRSMCSFLRQKTSH